GIRVKNEKITPDDFSTIGRGVGKCPNCENVIEDQVIKHQATNGGLGHQLYAVSFNQGKGSLEFRTPSQSDLDGVEKAHDYLQQKNSNYSLGSFILDIEIPKGEETDRLPKIGIEKWDQLFNPRQLLTLVTYVEIINEAKEKIRAELDEEKAAAIVTYLAMVLDRCVDRNCRLSIWHTARASVERASTQHALNLTWNYPEITGSRELWRGCADPVSSEYQGLCELLGNESQLIQLIQPDPELSKVTPRPRNPDLVAQIKAMAEQRNLPYSPQYLPYNKKLVDRAKELRKNMTPAEKKLWHEFLKYCDDRFWRQRPIDHFIVDFYCPARYLVIEIDGASHDSDEAQAYDEERTKVLEGYGLTVLRFTNQEVLENFEGVCEAIGHPPQPPFGRGESPPTPLWKGGVELELDDGSEVPFGRGESEGSEVPLEKGDLGGYQCHITAASADSLFHLADRSLDAIVTDPPYYSTIQYAELSDFFYVWQKHILGDIFPDLYTTELTDKDREAVANPSRFRNMGASPKDLADQDYEAKMQMAFSEYYRVLKDNGVMTVQFNHKDSGAWDVLAKSLIDAGFEITASWAVSTENPQNLHQAQKNSVSSTVLLVCRKRDPNAGSAWWDEVRIELSNTVTEKAPELEEALTPPNKEHHNPGINLYISAFGPALNVFSRAWPVLDSAGVEMRPEVAFEEARKAIVNYRFHKLIQTDAAGFDSLTQWYIIAWDAFRAREFPFDEARQLALAIGGFNVNDLAKTHKLLDSTSGTCKLLTPQQRLKKRAFSTNADEFSALALVDGLHAIIALYLEEQSIEPVRRFLKGT
ncbi:MAG: DUF559 domain-containing protein, partial [Prochlorotrichaceae cyanobacterium]